jgi:iron(III) transport system substrate-binding protein
MTTSLTGKPIGAALATVIFAAAMTALPTLGRSADFDTIKAAAVKEGTIVVWHNTPSQETTNALTALFNKRFGVNIKVQRVPVSGSDMTSRMMTEKRGGKITVDMFIANDRHLPLLVKNNLIEKVDWVGEFAGPDKIDAALMTSATNNMIPEFVGYGLEFRHDVYGFAYNTKMLSEQDAPKRWENLADPKWRRKFSIDAGLSPLARLVPVIGREGTIELAKRVAANRPIYADGQPAAATKVVSGEAPFGAMSLTSALDEVQKGAPIGLIFPEPQALISQLVVYVPKNAPHPNLAKLWAAWMVSEGMNTQPMVDEGVLRAWPGSPGPFGEYFTKHDLKVRRANSIQELDDANSIRKELDAVATGRAP